MLGRGVWGALHSVRSARQTLLLTKGSFFSANLSHWWFLDMRRGAGQSVWWRLSSFGTPSLNRRQKLVRHICFTRTLATGRAISKIWAPSNPAIYAQKLLSIRAKMRWGAEDLFCNDQFSFLRQLLVLFCHYIFSLWFVLSFKLRLPCVTWLLSPSTCTLHLKGPMTSRSLRLLPKSLSRTWTKLLISTTTRCLRYDFHSSVASMQPGLMNFL